MKGLVLFVWVISIFANHSLMAAKSVPTINQKSSSNNQTQGYPQSDKSFLDSKEIDLIKEGETNFDKVRPQVVGLADSNVNEVSNVTSWVAPNRDLQNTSQLEIDTDAESITEIWSLSTDNEILNESLISSGTRLLATTGFESGSDKFTTIFGINIVAGRIDYFSSLFGLLPIRIHSTINNGTVTYVGGASGQLALTEIDIEAGDITRKVDDIVSSNGSEFYYETSGFVFSYNGLGFRVLDKNTGSIDGSFVLENRGTSGIALMDNTLIAVDNILSGPEGGNYYLINTLDGAVSKTHIEGDQLVFSSNRNRVQVINSDEAIFDIDSTLYKYSIVTGEHSIIEENTGMSIGINGGFLYSNSVIYMARPINSNNRQLVAISANGEQVWESNLTYTRDKELKIVASNNHLFVLDGESIDIVNKLTGVLQRTIEHSLDLTDLSLNEFGILVTRSGQRDRGNILTAYSLEPDYDEDSMATWYERAYDLDIDSDDSLLDPDADGLNNLEEHDARTNPVMSDSDGDGLSDFEELRTHLTNPLSRDSDNDGMPDKYEIDNGLSPNNNSDAESDSDDDGLNNLEEFGTGTNPLNPDTDEDGLSDFEELRVYFTDPLNKDSDSDGLPDKYEIDNSLSPIDNGDAQLDSDDDGLSNLEEFKIGTDPNNTDTDGDGVSDGEEVTEYGTNALKKDTDGDSIDDNIEVARGTDPLANQDCLGFLCGSKYKGWRLAESIQKEQ
jgi:hypothetical protein